MKRQLKYFRKFTAVLVLAFILAICVLLCLETQTAFAESDKETDYTFDTVPVESIAISVDGNLSAIQPREEFSVSFVVEPWYTTVSEIFFDITPARSAIVKEVSEITLTDGVAGGRAIIAVDEDAKVGSTFEIRAGIDSVESNIIEMTVAKIPVEGLQLSLTGEGLNDRLHVGKTRSVGCRFTPSYASNQEVRYELTGSGMKYIEDFDEKSGTIFAKKDVAFIDVNSTVTITAYSVDNPNVFDSVTLTLYMPTTIVELSAATPLGMLTADGEALAVASSIAGDIVSLSAKINGVDSTGLNYIIIKGQEYVEDGYVHSDGTFKLRSTADWSESMKKPHPEVKIKAAYSDGFDEITIPIYIPVERISFVNSVVSDVENFRSYDMQAEAFPKYATLLADNSVPIYYSLGGIDSSIASIDGSGLLTLPKSLTSKGSVISYSANLTNAWSGVDVQPLTYDLTVIPVYAKEFKSVKITKDGAIVDFVNVKALPSDELKVEVVYDVDNVTDVDITLGADSDAVSTFGNLITVAPLSQMNADKYLINISAGYDHGGSVFSNICILEIYVPALSAEIADNTFHRDEALDLNDLVTINGHGHATNKVIEWGQPQIISGSSGISTQIGNGLLSITRSANAGTVVKVPYRTFDSDIWQYKEFTVAALDSSFTFEYLQTADKDGHKYDIDYAQPQLEEGRSVEVLLKYKGMGGINYGLTYSVEASSNATFVCSNGVKEHDKFTLGVKAGQSGRNNYVTFIITVHDGTQTYYIYTDGASVPNGNKSKLNIKDISVFKRISGALNVSQSSIEAKKAFDLIGWDSSYTYNKEDLVWAISGGKMNGNVIMSAPKSGFILTISANQKYNGQEINFYSEIAFSSIVYYYENSNSEIIHVKSVYKKQGSSISIAGELCNRFGYLQTGWSTSNNGAKDYVFNESYSDYQDKTLYAYWVKIQTTVTITQTLSVDENQNQNIYTQYAYADFSIKELKELGYKQIEILFAYDLKKIKQNGDCAKIWLELNGENVFVRDKFSLSSSKETYYSEVTLDIDKFIEKEQFRVGLFAYGDWKIGKYTFEFYEANITMTAIK